MPALDLLARRADPRLRPSNAPLHAATPGVSATKLAPPLPPTMLVERPGLLARATAMATGGVTLLRAPSGFGKTTLLQGCLQQLARSGTAAAWLNLDASDNDAQRLLVCLGEACIRALAREGCVKPNPAEPGLTAAALADRLFTTLEQTQRPFALLLDDFEALTDSAALGWIAALMDRLPPHGRLLIASRRMPDLPLARLRARGRLCELDVSALRFTLPEAQALLNVQRQLGLADKDLQRLHERTEGWVAGLSLAGQALNGLGLDDAQGRGQLVEQFSGCYATVSHYLAECVLERQPVPVRRFLLHTCVLDTFDAELCMALMPDTDARAMLDQLARADVPLVPLDGNGRWFRYHSMFRRFLQSVLERESPALRQLLHRRAAAWFAAGQRPVPAISHALEGEDFVQATALLRTHAQALLMQGRTRLLERWLNALPQALLQQQPWLQAMQAWATLYTQGAEAASALLDRYGLAHSPEAEVQDSLRSLKPVLLALMDRVEESVALGLECIAQRPELCSFADGVLLCSVACVLVNLGDFQRGRALLDRARRIEAVAESGFAVMHCEVAEAIIDGQAGRLRQAGARMAVAVDASRRGISAPSVGNAWAGVLQACACYETGDVAQAERLLRAHAPAVQAVGMADMLILVYRSLARIAFRRGDVDEAFQQLSELQYLGYRRRLDRVVACAALERSRLMLEQGHVAAAREELQRAGDEALWQRVKSMRLVANELDDRDIGHWRWQIHAGEAADALAAMQTAIAQATAEGRHHRVFKLRLLQAIALDQLARHDEAAQAIGDLLQATWAEQMVQLHADEGRLACQLLARYAHSGRGQQASAANPGLASHLQQVLQAFGPHEAPAPPKDAGSGAAPAEPLTRRELAVLKLVADGLADSDMADKLFLSISTVRTHLRSIYTKLGAHSRMQAVLAARRAGAL